MTMDIYTKPGQKVYFLGKNGYPIELNNALEIFEIGQELTVEYIDVSGFTSYVKFKEENSRTWNSVMFDNVENRMIDVKRVDGWLTTDGKMHKTEEYAIQHQKYINLRKGIKALLEENMAAPDSPINSSFAATILSENKQTLYDLLKKNL